jgi:sec-independent protein translocase protein TatA
MGRIGLTELLVILGIVIFLFGAKRIPEMGKGIGEGIRNFKKSMKNDDAEETGSDEHKSKVA